MKPLSIYKSIWYCRWCGVQYEPKKATDRDGFCCDGHKMAWHRAFRKYVTTRRDRKQGLRSKSIKE